VGAAWGLAITEAAVLPLWVATFRRAIVATEQNQPNATLPG
jgi:hypothetical protein